jgi:hypothetical protein
MTTMRQIRARLLKTQKDLASLRLAFELRDYPLTIDNCTRDEVVLMTNIEKWLEDMRLRSVCIHGNLNDLEHIHKIK